MSTKPTIVFVHGSWHSPECWNKVVSLLEAQQFKCVAPSLPSTEGSNTASFEDDLNAVRNAIVAETTQGRDVVVVTHSFGGIVGQSAIKGLTRPKQDAPSSANDTSGHVIGLVNIATAFSQTGMKSFLDGLGGKPPPSWKIDPSGFAEIVVPPRELFYHDLPEEEGDYWVSRLRKQSVKALAEGGEHMYTGWMDVPVWHLTTAEDKGLPIEAQKYLIQLAKDSGGDVTVREIASSHSPMLSRPKETADFILEAVTTFTG
ncbi:alpha/beta-hydrolase [Rhizodiscina lignyota]|uniref:Alpha/beta-hydrolase n=1 Tax=Rhizodiscina lignyota TaxID=1504668 RepID=A0A9P4M6H7_9PEZI|nr:alpha/beta-hydrolase [Rhizodiscina lignyota]